jgi:hypothetical protein
MSNHTTAPRRPRHFDALALFPVVCVSLLILSIVLILTGVWASLT